MTPDALHAATLVRLRSIATMSIYDGEVPKSPPADAAGRVLPYAVLWPNPGFTPEEARNMEHDAGGGLTWDARVTVAAGDVTWCLRAAVTVRAHLDAWAITPWSLLSELPGGPEMLPDPDTFPVRWFAPMTFRTTV